jgi:hypothetical protein
MNKLEMVQSLWEEIKRRSISHEDLVQIFDDYQDMVADFTKSGEPYRAALLHVHEEFPDMQRLVGRKHDEILKGRLVDAISSLKEKIELMESQTTESPETGEPSEPETHIRNKPNLRME